MTIEVEYVQGQNIRTLTVAVGSTIKNAIGDIKDAVGVFGKQKDLDYVLQAGDRIEIYKPLLMDPKEARRQRAKG